jgi:hypothetical protein
MNAQLELLHDRGYTVELAHQGDGFEVYWVDGFGLSLYVRDDDADMLAMLTDEALHDERVLQASETREETERRWVREGRSPAPYEN